MTAVLNSRNYSGTQAQRLAFGVPTPFAGLTTWEETDTGVAYVWNPVQAAWTIIGPVFLTGTLSNDVAAAVGDAIGTRPLANTLALGSQFCALDCAYFGFVIPHPITVGQKLWRGNASTLRNWRGTASGAGATQFHMGVYNPGTGVFTQATVLGQFCNAVASSTVGAGASMIVSLGPSLLTLVLVGAGGLTGGVEFMSDASGFAVIYAAGPGVIPLGVAQSTVIAGDSITLPFYDY